MLNHFLAGPILRRTTQNRICVWLALDKPLKLSLEILDMDEKPVGASKPEQLEDSRIQLGDNLYVYLLRAYPTGPAPFATGVQLYYRLLDEKSKPLNLKKEKLTYGDLKHPTFHIPNTLASVLHGSCRKPHGITLGPPAEESCWDKGKALTTKMFQQIKLLPPDREVYSFEDKGFDTLSIGDDLLERHHKEGLGCRPDVLLLTGDQIYADDVAASLLAVLREEAKNLIGAEDCLPLREFDDTADTQKCLKLKLRMEIRKLLNGALDLLGRKTPAPPQGPSLNPAGIPLGGRQEVLQACNSGFSSTEAGNHLMSFGEFAAMYIYAFGNAKGWATPAWTDIPDSHVPVTHARKREEILRHSEAVEIFSETLGKVRRLLANIPTYMIFDDHDVTDDWNITGHWYGKVRSSPLGRRIVSNALAAYWAFQGWGNDPDNFDKDMIASIRLHLNSHDPDPYIDERYDLYTWKHRGWGFSIPTNPPIIAMDSRTQRQPDNPFYPARLMDRYALDWLRVEWTKLKTPKDSLRDAADYPITEDTCPLFIATTPVMGFSPVENIVQFALWAIGYLENVWFIRFPEELLGAPGWLTGKAVNFFDAEAWTANLTGFTDLMDTLLHKMGIKKCAFLSGDVHYAFTAAGHYQSSNANSCEQESLCCRQLNSSALRNKPSDGQVGALKRMENLEGGKTKKGNPWQFYASQWRLEHTLIQSTGGNRVVADCNLGQVLFEQGEPTKHLLWLAPGMSNEYSIPAFKDDDTCPK